MNIKVAVVDDHKMVSKAIEDMIRLNSKYDVCMNCSNGDDLIDTLEKTDERPDVILMDINMPFRNGIDTTKYLTNHYPELKVIALTMEDSESTIIKMVKAGAKGYLLKDMPPEILFEAIDTVYLRGSFYTDHISDQLLKVEEEDREAVSAFSELKEKEREFVRLACSEFTYKEIAEQMFMSHKTIDGYRDNVFLKLNVKSRVGLVMYAIKHHLV